VKTKYKNALGNNENDNKIVRMHKY